MIPLNAWQRLPPKAIWFGVLSRLIVAIVLIAVASLFQFAGNTGTMKCSGACGPTSGSVLIGFFYIYGIYLVGSSVLYYQTFAFLLTNKTLTTVAGYFYRSSSTFRLERIQDIDTFRSPIHAMFGLKTVAIWTASPDQYAGKRKRPDGRIVLDADTADWLREFLSNPPAATDDAAPVVSGQQSALLKTAPRANAGLVIVLSIAAVLAVLVMMIWKNTSIIRPGTPATTAGATAPAVAAAPQTGTATRKHLAAARPLVAAQQPVPAQQPAPSAAAVQAAAANYAIACAIHGSGSIDGVIPCAKFAESQRCQRETDFPSRPMAQSAVLTLANQSSEDIKLYWLNPTGARALYASLPPGGHVNQQSRIGARWLVTTKDDHCIAIFDAATTTIGFF
jgi:membrane protein YdbS with pleckstrin-like domain